MDFIRKYVVRRILHNGNVYHEVDTLRELISMKTARIICGTIPTIQMLIEVWDQELDINILRYLIINEG